MNKEYGTGLLSFLNVLDAARKDKNLRGKSSFSRRSAARWRAAGSGGAHLLAAGALFLVARSAVFPRDAVWKPSGADDDTGRTSSGGVHPKVVGLTGLMGGRGRGARGGAPLPL